jgi:hypothetical protein
MTFDWGYDVLNDKFKTNKYKAHFIAKSVDCG